MDPKFIVGHQPTTRVYYLLYSYISYFVISKPENQVVGLTDILMRFLGFQWFTLFNSRIETYTLTARALSSGGFWRVVERSRAKMRIED